MSAAGYLKKLNFYLYVFSLFSSKTENKSKA